MTSDSTVSVGDFTFAVRARAFANLAYQLDCLSGQIHRSCDAIRALWIPSWTKDDDDALATWSAVSKRYSTSAPFGGGAPSAPMPLPYGELELDKRLRIAGLLSSTTDDYWMNLRALLPPQDADKLVHAAERFRPRFEAWWNASGAQVADRFREGLEGLFQHGELGQIITRAARFYATALPQGTTIDFDLVVLPTTPKSTSAEQMLSHGVIEITKDDKPDQRMDVVCHELFHFFYSSRSPEQQAALAASFEVSSDPVAAVAYFLLDESMATALGNGVVDRSVNPPDYAKRSSRELGFYTNHAIDATAKSLLTRTGGDPTLGAPLDSPATIAAVIAAARDAVGDDPRPIEYLHSYAGAADEGWWELAMHHTDDKASSNNVYDSAPLDSPDATSMVVKHPALSAVVIVPRKRLPALGAYGDSIPASVRAAVGREARRAGSFAYVWRRSRHAMLFVIVADDPKGASDVADALFQSDKAVIGVFRAPG